MEPKTPENIKLADELVEHLVFEVESGHLSYEAAVHHLRAALIYLNSKV